MSNAAALLLEDSSGTLRIRLKNALTLAQIVSGATITATLTKAGVAVFSNRSMTYGAAEKLWSGDDESGAWTCSVAASEVTTSDRSAYVATITVVVSAVTVHTVTLIVPVVVDTGRRSL